jgi:heme exporter protein CcmD
MAWQSLEQFLSMDGHGLFVWGAYVPTLLALAYEAWSTRARWKLALAVDAEELP